MKYDIVAFITFLAAAIVFSMNADAAPSFSCQANLNRTERVICDNDELSRLDREMVAVYRSVSGGQTGTSPESLAAEQKAWLRSRNACGSRVNCIRSHYLDRTAALKSLTTIQSEAARTVELNWRILPDGTMERRLADGSKRLRRPDGETEYYLPDGSLHDPNVQAVHVPRPDLPALPGELTNWGSGLELRLLNVLRNILTPDEMEAYLQTEKDKDFYDVIEWRIDSIVFLTREPS